jgi:hypothetical protein
MRMSSDRGRSSARGKVSVPLAKGCVACANPAYGFCKQSPALCVFKAGKTSEGLPPCPALRLPLAALLG